MSFRVPPKKNETMKVDLPVVEPTRLKKYAQVKLGSFPQVRVKHKKHVNPPPKEV